MNADPLAPVVPPVTPRPRAQPPRAMPSIGAEIPAAVLPRRGFLPSYLTHARTLTDAPPIYHLAVGLTVLAGAAGNRVHVHAHGQNLLPHLWTLLTAPSSYYRKTTAMRIGMELLRRAAPAAILPNDFSRERFLENSERNPAGVIQLGEFAGFLAVLGRDYMSGLKENLTDLYDAPTQWERQLQSRTVKIMLPALSILAASTIDWLRARVKDGDLRGGFLTRFTLWPATEKLEWKGLVTQDDERVSGELVAVLSRLHKRESRRLAITSAALDLYNAWLRRHEDEDVTGELQGFHVRLETVALKAAMLYQLSSDEPAGIDVRSIDDSSMRCATALADLLWANTRRVIEATVVGGTRFGPTLERIRELACHNGGVDRRDLLRRTGLTLRELGPLIETLVERGEIQAREERRGRGPKTVRYGRPTVADGSDGSDR